jgi:hypothetical protein
MVARHRFCIAGALVLAAALASVAQGANEIQQVLETGWKPSAENYAAAQQQYEQSKGMAATDARAPLAIALVSLKNFKVDDAQKYLGQAMTSSSAAKLDPTSLSVRRLKVYLDIHRKDAANAQVDIHALAQMLATDDPIAPKPESKQAAEWLGNVIGYLAGPAADSGFALKADTVQADVLTMLKGPLANSVSDGKAAALKQYDSLKQQQASARTDAKAKAAAKRAEDIKQVEAQRATIADKLKKLEDPAAKDTASTTGKKDATKDAKDAEANQQKAQQMQQQAQRLQLAIQAEQKKPRANQQLIMRLNTQLAMLEQKATEAGLTPDQQQMQHQEDQKKQNAEAERKKLTAQDNTLAAKAKQLASATDSPNLPTTVDSKINAIMSYAPIDLDQEKQRLVASYGQ